MMGSSQVTIRVANGSLDYENPNQRKFIVLVCEHGLWTKGMRNYFPFFHPKVIAEEIGASNKSSAASSTATITVSITDTNDNRPVFDEESYSISVLGIRKMSHVIPTGELTMISVSLQKRHMLVN